MRSLESRSVAWRWRAGSSGYATRLGCAVALMMLAACSGECGASREFTIIESCAHAVQQRDLGAAEVCYAAYLWRRDPASGGRATREHALRGDFPRSELEAMARKLDGTAGAADAWNGVGIARSDAGDQKGAIAAWHRAMKQRDPNDVRGRLQDV